MPTSELLESELPTVSTATVGPCGDFHPLAPLEPYPSHNLPTEDGEPLETNWHAMQIPFLVEIITWHRRGRTDYYVGGNAFVYYSPDQVKTRDYRGPDFFLVNGATYWPARPCWVVWQEQGKFPDLIVELLSPKTRKTDLTTKFEIYETIFETPEYVAYDPGKKELLAWRKVNGKFQPIPPDLHGNYPLASAELAIGTWDGPRYQFDGTWLRFFDEDGVVVPIGAEAEKARADALAAEVARLKAQLQNPA